MASSENQWWPAPAKLNLMLHITGRRDDGYHLLQTVFQFVDYGDRLQFATRDDGRIVLLGAVEAQPQKDLVYRAAQCLRQHCQIRQGVVIRLDKRLPTGAGLGGGSSDAATTLVALNRLWRCGLDEDALVALGLQLGADVPVFIRGEAAFAEGIGEKLSPIDLPEDWFVVLTPPVHVPTGEIFCKPHLTRDCSAIKICDLSSRPWRNVCTPVVVESYPQVGQAIEMLGEFAEARMSGTGASVFARFPRAGQANDVAQALRAKLPPDWRCFVAQGKNRSPLRECFGNFEC